jgi:ElaB/YqjD/DUF883 family membrane-anchored ribosome-binding protein
MVNAQRITPNDAQSDALARDFKNAVNDAQDLLKSMGSEGDAKLNEVKKRVQGSLDIALRRLDDWQATVVDGATAAARTTDDYVHTNPWAAIGVGAGFGVLVGFLLARR